MSSGWPVTGAILAWIGGAMFVLGDGRRLHGFALATAGAGLAFDVGTTVGPPWGWGFAAVALATGLIRQASDDEDWGLGSAGSTPRITLALLSGPAAAWLGFRIFPSGSGWINAGLIVIMILATARLLAGTRLSVVLTAGSLFALLIGAVSSLTESHALQLEGPLAAAIVFAILGARVPKGVYLGVLICGVAVIATPGVVAAAALGWRLAHVPSPTGAVLLLAVGAVPLWALCGPNRVTGGHRQLAVMIGLAVIGTVVTATAISAVALVILLVAGGQAAWEGKSGV
ncbi:MAG TPA: hypothetical protein VG015_09155, partial [Candidatus Dormibacteraeota bacterium]|nr:hypothetical protein [Candidatus Dormibacteraeota bacterium]